MTKRQRGGFRPHSAPPLRELDNTRIVAYLAGLLDSNGRITIRRQHPWGHPDLKNTSYALEVAVCTTDSDLIRYLTGTVGGSNVTTNAESGSQRWRVFGDNAEALIRAVRPYLVRRAPNAEVGLAFRNIHHRVTRGAAQNEAELAARELLWRRMRALDSNGRHEWPEEPLILPPTRTTKQAESDSRLRRLSDEQEGAIAGAYTDGLTIDRLASSYGVSSPTIRRILDKYNVPTRARGVRPRTLPLAAVS